MPLFHFTLHAYRSWRADNPKGYVQHGHLGLQEPNPLLAYHRESMASAPAACFNDDQKSLVLGTLPDTCQRRTLRVHGASVTLTHMHAVVSWQDDRDAEEVQAGLKSGLGFVLSEQKGSKDNRWFSHGGLPEPVDGDEHFTYLLREYLPKHLNEGGLVRIYDEEVPHPQDLLPAPKVRGLKHHKTRRED